MSFTRMCACAVIHVTSHFLTLDSYNSCWGKRSALMILSADLIVNCRLKIQFHCYMLMNVHKQACILLVASWKGVLKDGEGYSLCNPQSAVFGRLHQKSKFPLISPLLLPVAYDTKSHLIASQMFVFVYVPICVKGVPVAKGFHKLSL